MYITDYLYEMFSKYIENSGGDSIGGKISKNSPDIRFLWRGDLFFGYRKGNGYEIFGMSIEDLEENWQGFLKRVKEDQDQKEAESNG